MKGFFKTGLILMTYCAVAGLGLGLVYSITKDRITSAEFKNKTQAVEHVLKDENGSYLVPISEIENTVFNTKSTDEILYETDKGKVLSPVYVFEVSNQKIYVVTGSSIGFGGPVVTVASFVEDNKGISLHSIKVIEYSQETPGLGAKIADSSIQKRFYPLDSTALENGVNVDKDVGSPDLPPDEAKKNGIVKVSDVMTGATITPRAVVNSINTMYEYLVKRMGGSEQ